MWFGMVMEKLMLGAAKWTRYFINHDPRGLSAEDRDYADMWLRAQEPWNVIGFVIGSTRTCHSFRLHTGIASPEGDIVAYIMQRGAEG